MDRIERLVLELIEELKIPKGMDELYMQDSYEPFGEGFRKVVKNMAIYYRLSQDRTSVVFDSIQNMDIGSYNVVANTNAANPQTPTPIK